jgi:hypothetical protein
MPTLNLASSAPTLQSSALPQGTPDPLAGLRDIHLPSEISNLPLAPGWWLLAALLLVAAIAGFIHHRRQRQRRQYRREALELLKQLMSDHKETDSSAATLQNINTLLKRVALAAYPHIPVARYHGQEWTQFLHQAAPSLSQPEELVEIVSNGIYAPPARQGEQLAISHDLIIFHDYAQRWVQKHLPEAKLTLTTEATHAAP